MRILFLSFYLLTCISAQSQQPQMVVPLSHKSSLEDVEISPNGRLVMTNARDNVVKLWDVNTGRLLMDLYGISKNITYADFSRDGNFIFTGSEDGIATLWQVSEGKMLGRIDTGSDFILSAAITADNKFIAIPHQNKLSLWEFATGTPLWIAQPHSSQINAVKISGDNNFLISVSSDSSAAITEIKTGKKLGEYKTDFNGIHDLSFSADGNLVNLIAWNKVFVCDLKANKIISTLSGHTRKIFTAVFSPDGSQIITASADSTARIWDSRTGSLVHSIKGNQSYVEAIFSSDGKRFATAGENVRIWDTRTTMPIFTTETSGFNRGVRFLSNDKYLLHFSFRDFTIREVEKGEVLSKMEAHTSALNLASFSPDGSKIATSTGSSVKIWNSVSGQIESSLGTKTSDAHELIFSPDNSLICVRYYSPPAEVFEVSSGKMLYRLPEELKFVRHVTFSPDSKKILVTANQKTMNLFEAATGKLIKKFTEMAAYENEAVFSPDGKQIASRGGIARLWSADDLNMQAALMGHQANVDKLVYSNNGKKLATVSSDRTAKIWNTENGELLQDLKAHKDYVIDACFSPDDNMLVTSSWDRTVKVWNSTTGKLIFTLQTDEGAGNNRLYFSSDKKFLIAIKELTSVENNTAWIWDISSGELVKSFHNLGYICDYKNGWLLSITGGEVCLTNITDQNKKARFVAIGNKDYLTILPGSYYLATQPASKILHYVNPGHKIITFEQLDLKYNRPDLVLKTIGHPDTLLITAYNNAYYKRIRKAGLDTTNLHKDFFSLPEADFSGREKISFEQTKDALKLRIKAKDSKYRLDRLNVWINEVPLFGTKGILLRNRKIKSFDTVITVKLSNGINQVETSVTNENGLESFRIPLRLSYKASRPIKEKLYFVGIGVNRFNQPGHNLNWSVKDIRDLADSLKKRYQDAIIIDTLFDEKVSLANVFALKKRLLGATVNDKVILAYSGHGLLNSNYDYFLSTYMVNFHKPEEGGLPYEAFENLLDNIPIRQKLILIDACHSGEVDKEDMKNYRRIFSSDSLIKGGEVLADTSGRKMGTKSSFELMQDLFVNVGRGTGATIISAAAGTQFALEQGDLQNGVFTYSILEYMKNNPTASVSDLKIYVNKRVPELTSGLQVPTSRSENKVADWKVW